MYNSNSSPSSSSWTDGYPSPLDDFWSLSFQFSPLWASTFPLDKGKIISQPSPFPPSPCSSISTDLSPSPEPATTRVVCNVPLLAPRPLPYHSPTFLQFDLPDSDEDLSHPPYTHRPSKRKRDDDDSTPSDNSRTKRHAGIDLWAAHVHRQARCGTLATQGHSHVYPGTRRHRLR